MVTRACISINNTCNLNCLYCHFHEKKDSIHEEEMNVIGILDRIRDHIIRNNIPVFKLGFVGNGEPLLEYEKLKEYLIYISDFLEEGRIAAYTITNGLLLDEERIRFLGDHRVNVGFSIDGIPQIHNKYRCGTYEQTVEKIDLYKTVLGRYPTMNCTVGEETLQYIDETLEFFKRFNTRITFSRMIGKYGISLDQYHFFLNEAKMKLNVRTGGYDCTIYGGLCAAGMDNIFYANNRIFICGNCIDLPISLPVETDLDKIDFGVDVFNRKRCFKEVFYS